MTRKEAIEIGNELLTEYTLRPMGQVKISDYFVALLIRLELLQVDDE